MLMRTLVRLLSLYSLWSGAAWAADLVRIPPAARSLKDPLTGLQVKVSVGEFLIAPSETTQREFREVMGYNPSVYAGDDRPVENVSWWEAIRYCNLRSLRERLEPCYNLETGDCDFSRNGYRLPTDAEWEQASGGAAALDQANVGSKDTKDADLLVKAVREKGTRNVGSYPPNRFGLYDMVGNVWEWCHDYFNTVATPQPVDNPAGPLRGMARIIRGGSFISTTGNWARGYRSSLEPDRKSRFTGFRVCRNGARTSAPVAIGDEFFKPYNVVPAGFETSTGNLSSLTGGAATRAAWIERRKAIRAKWTKLLGSPSIDPPAPAVRRSKPCATTTTPASSCTCRQSRIPGKRFTSSCRRKPYGGRFLS